MGRISLISLHVHPLLTRWILNKHARRRNLKRGRDVRRVPLDDTAMVGSEA